MTRRFVSVCNYCCSDSLSLSVLISNTYSDNNNFLISLCCLYPAYHILLSIYPKFISIKMQPLCVCPPQHQWVWNKRRWKLTPAVLLRITYIICMWLWKILRAAQWAVSDVYLTDQRAGTRRTDIIVHSYSQRQSFFNVCVCVWMYFPVWLWRPSAAFSSSEETCLPGAFRFLWGHLKVKAERYKDGWEREVVMSRQQKSIWKQTCCLTAH